MNSADKAVTQTNPRTSLGVIFALIVVKVCFQVICLVITYW